MGNFQKYWSQNVGQDFIVLDLFVGGYRAGGKGVCGRLMSPAHETQSMREKRLLRGRLPRKGGGLTGMETYRCIRLYVWFKDDKHVIWMWIWLILKNISLLDRIWSLFLVRFAHSTTNFIFWLDMLIFSVSINSHPDNIYISHSRPWLIIIFFHINRNKCIN